MSHEVFEPHVGNQTAEEPRPGVANGPPVEVVAGWPAQLDLEFGRDSVGTRMVHCQHRGPLRVQRPFYPEGPDTPHVYLLHPPGGLAGGDELTISVTVGSSASALVTTPAAGKVYRTAGRIAQQKQLVRIEQGGALEWFPQENIVFNGADALLETRVSLAPDARFIGWDIVCLGRPASDEKFTVGRLRQRFELYRESLPLCIERSTWEGGSRSLVGRFGLQKSVAVGVLFVTPASPELLPIARGIAAPSALPGPSGADVDRVSATLVGPRGEVLCCRYLGASAARGREYFARVWARVRPELLGKQAVVPRIWFT